MWPWRGAGRRSSLKKWMTTGGKWGFVVQSPLNEDLYVHVCQKPFGGLEWMSSWPKDGLSLRDWRCSFTNGLEKELHSYIGDVALLIHWRCSFTHTVYGKAASLIDSCTGYWRVLIWNRPGIVSREAKEKMLTRCVASNVPRYVCVLVQT